MALDTIYDVGDRVRVRFRFNVDGAAADPSEVIVRVKPPRAAVQVFRFSLGEVEHEELGTFYRDVSFSTSGIWYVRGEGTGAVEAAKTESFRVRNDPFTT